MGAGGAPDRSLEPVEDGQACARPGSPARSRPRGPGRWAGPGSPTRRPAAANPSAVTSNGLFGSSTAVSTPSDTTTASGAKRSMILHQAVKRVEPAQVAGARGQRTVAVRARPVDLVRVAHGVGEPTRARVDVERAIEDGRVVPEAGLSAVAVVGVDVHDGDGARAAAPEPGGGDGGIVEIATSAEKARTGMVTRGPADGVGGRRPSQDEVGGGGRRIAGRLGAGPGALAHRGHGVHGVPAQLGPDRRRRRGPGRRRDGRRRQGTSTRSHTARRGPRGGRRPPIARARTPGRRGTGARGRPAARPDRGRPPRGSGPRPRGRPRGGRDLARATRRRRC